MNKARVLCVDDEPRVLDGLKLVLGRRFDLHTADSGEGGLEILDADGPFEVIVSDMRMPRMDGATFLAKARERAEDTVRLLLTGGTDLESAVKAVNEGQIFRFLTKPIDRDDLVKAIESAVELHRLQTAEKVLLEQTLRGSIQALTDVLSLVNPVAFGRAGRIKRLVGELAEHQKTPHRWQVEVAAMLSQVGYVTLAPDTVHKVFQGKTLTPEEEDALAKVPSFTAKILANIPRLDPILEILNQVTKPAGGTGTKRPPMGARLLRVASDYDLLETQGHSGAIAIESMRRQSGAYDVDLLDALAEITQAGEGGQALQGVPLEELRPGMIFAEDVFLKTGVLFVARGYEVTESFIEIARSLDSGAVADKVLVLAG